MGSTTHTLRPKSYPSLKFCILEFYFKSILILFGFQLQINSIYQIPKLHCSLTEIEVSYLIFILLFLMLTICSSYLFLQMVINPDPQILSVLDHASSLLIIWNLYIITLNHFHQSHFKTWSRGIIIYYYHFRYLLCSCTTGQLHLHLHLSHDIPTDANSCPLPYQAYTSLFPPDFTSCHFLQ